MTKLGAEDDGPSTLDGVLDEVEHSIGAEGATPPTMTMGDLLSSVGRQSYGPLLLLIGLFAISPATVLPGMTWFAAALTLIVAGQMALGLKHIWLPGWVLRAKAPRALVRGGVREARSWSSRLSVLLRPRLTFLTKPPFVNLIALLVIAAALVTFPLGLIPLAPLAPGLAVAFFGLGMVARDGLWLGFGAMILGGASWLFRALIF
ncbi:exopolysaccharide biosynthesis protein [Terricaulis sp.]|uniref:exopolysaccharide biosynthesis protein n=1 Tax=Terricaulis sp. TaxID=2768686 RepID=UPI003784B335